MKVAVWISKKVNQSLELKCFLPSFTGSRQHRTSHFLLQPSHASEYCLVKAFKDIMLVPFTHCQQVLNTLQIRPTPWRERNRVVRPCKPIQEWNVHLPPYLIQWYSTDTQYYLDTAKKRVIKLNRSCRNIPCRSWRPGPVRTHCGSTRSVPWREEEERAHQTKDNAQALKCKFTPGLKV